MKINGKDVSQTDLEFLDHRIKVTNDQLLLENKQNEIDFAFENTFVDNSAGLHKYVDPKDNRTYIYSHCEPFFCHRWFPCFDQPSVRAPLDLQVLSPSQEWKVIANGATKSIEKADNA